MKKTITLRNFISLKWMTFFFVSMIISQIWAQSNTAALNFDGNNDHIDLGKVLNMGTTDFTVEAWFNTKNFQYANNTGDARIILVKGGSVCSTPQFAGYALFVNNIGGTNNLEFWVNGTPIRATGLITNKWYHGVGVRQGNMISLYLDGVLVKTVSMGSTVNVDNDDTFGIGAGIRPPNSSCGTNTLSFDGKLDEVRIWNRALSATEIAANTFKTLTGTEGGLMAYYNFDEGTPNGNNVGKTTLKDLAGGDQNGTLKNFALTGNFSNWVEPRGNSSLDNGLVAYYPFNSNANDESGNGNNGFNNGASLTVDRLGNVDRAYSFNGTNAHISFSKLPTTQVDNMTVSLWVKPSDLNQLGMALNYGYDNGTTGDGFAIGIAGGTTGTVSASGNKLQFVHGDISFLPGNYTFSDVNTWVHLVVIREQSSSKIYTNGRLVATYPNPIKPPTEFRIGSAIGIRFFKGAIDDIRIYNRAITINEIAQLYGTPVSCSNPTPLSILNLTPSLNKTAYNVMEGATVHHYFQIKDNVNNPISGTQVLYHLENTPSVILKSTVSNSLGIVDLAINLSGKDKNNLNDDLIRANNSAFIVFDNATCTSSIINNDFKKFPIVVAPFEGNGLTKGFYLKGSVDLGVCDGCIGAGPLGASAASITLGKGLGFDLSWSDNNEGGVDWNVETSNSIDVKFSQDVHLGTIKTGGLTAGILQDSKLKFTNLKGKA